MFSNNARGTVIYQIITIKGNKHNEWGGTIKFYLKRHIPMMEPKIVRGVSSGSNVERKRKKKNWMDWFGLVRNET